MPTQVCGLYLKCNKEGGFSLYIILLFLDAQASLAHCVTTADPTHIEEYTKFYCWYAHALLLCARICNCWNFLSSPLVLPVLSYWWTKYQFYEISICQTKPSMEGVFPPKLLLYTQTYVPNACCANICTYSSAHILVKSKTMTCSFFCCWHFWGF